MNKHGLTRNSENEPVCRCGFRPDVLDTVAPIGRDWKAKSIILNHAAALNNRIVTYPRASVEPTGDGRWKLTLWDAHEVEHALAEEESKFDTLAEAYDYGALRIGACRQSGTNLNGMAVA
jgi:hypothetical protein